MFPLFVVLLIYFVMLIVIVQEVRYSITLPTNFCSSVDSCVCHKMKPRFYLNVPKQMK